MSRRAQLFKGTLAVALSFGLGGCTSGMTTYFPNVVARGELTLRYDDGFQIYGGNRVVAESYSYDGLSDYVRCVPEAASHAKSAESRGQTAITLSTLGIVFGLSGMGGIGGVYFYEKDPELMWGILGSGLVLAISGVVLGGLSRRAKEDAHGHALDAVNYYNDAVGSLGATCDDLEYPAPAGPAAEGEAAQPPAPAPPSGQVPRYVDPQEQPEAPPAAPEAPPPPAAPTAPAPTSPSRPAPPPNWPDVTPRSPGAPAPTPPPPPPSTQQI